MTTSDRKRGRPCDDAARARKRVELLDTAARVFARHGFPGTDMQALADAAGVAKGTLYLYFPSKEELFLAAVDQGLCQLQDHIDVAIEAIPDPIDRIVAAMSAYLDFFRAHPTQAELLIQERAEFRDRKQPTYLTHRERRREVWHAVLRDLIAAGRLRPVPVARIDNVLSDLLYGTMFTNHFSGRYRPLREQVDDILDIVFHGMLTEAEKARRQPAASGERS